MRLLVALTLLLFLLPAVSQAQDDDGGGFLTRQIEGALSGAGRDVSIVGFRGALSSEATFDRMTIADANGIWLTLEDVALNWRRLALIRGRLEVESLTAGSLQITRLPETEEEDMEVPAAEAEPFSLNLPDLPVSINIAAFEVSEIDLGAPIIGEPVRLSLTASAVFDEEGLNVDLDANRVDGKEGAFDIEIVVQRDGSEIDLNLAMEEAEGGIAARLMNLPGLPSVSLKVAGKGPLDDFKTDIDLATDGEQRLAGQVALLAEPVEGSPFPNRRVQATLGGDITPLIAPEYTEFFGPDVGLDVNTLLLADGAVNVDDFSVTARAVDLSGSLRLEAQKWPAFVDVKGRIGQERGSVVLPGTNAGVSVSDITLDLFLDTNEGDTLRGDLIVSDLTHDAARIDQVRLSLDGVLASSASGIGRFAANVDVDARGLNLTDQDVGAALGDTLRGKAFVSYRQDAPLLIEKLTLTGPEFGVDGDIEIADLTDGFPTDLDIRARADNLARFAGLAGQPLAGAADLSIKGKVTPLSGMFGLAISGTTRDIAVNIPEADVLMSGRTELSLTASRDENGTFIRDLDLANDALNLTAEAALRTNDSDVTARAALRDIALVLPQYQGPVQVDVAARQTAEGWWQVETEVDAPYDSRATVSGLATGPDTDLSFVISVPEVRPFAPAVSGPLNARGRLWLSPEGYNVDVAAAGPLGTDVQVEGLATGPDARVNLTASLANMGALIPELAGRLDLDGEVARSGPTDWAIDTRLSGPAGMTADIAGTVAADGATADLQAVGRVPLELAGPFVAPSSVTGPLAFDLALKGAPSLEALSGTITTSDVRYSDPTLRLGLNNVATRVRLQRNSADFDVGADISTGGRATVNGSVNLVSLAGNVALALQRAVLVDPNLYEAILDADIDVRGPLTGGATISGRIDLEEVNVTVPGTGATSIGSIPEIRHVGASGKVTETRARAGVIPKETAARSGPAAPAFPLSININAPSRIFIRGRGINAEMGGNLQLRGTSNAPISTGDFDLIRGRLDIIGKRFGLDEGAVQFQGSLTPYIRFVTSTAVPGGTASITVDGPANAPEITFSAIPEAPEDEVLSLILFGRYVSELSAFQALQLANGISQLTGRGGVNVIGNFRDGIGLDELDVTTDEAGSTSVTAGKYITENIYTDVTSNSERGADISLNIDLTRDLKAKATVAEDGDSSIGFFFERDY